MSAIYVGYHKTFEREGFQGKALLADARITLGATIYVVSNPINPARGHAIYYLEGKFSVTACRQNSSPVYAEHEHEYTLSAAKRPTAPLPLASCAQFDREEFHNNFSSGHGVRLLKGEKLKWAKLFDDLLGDSEESSVSELLEDFAAIDSAESGYSTTERDEMRKARVGQGKFRRECVECWGGEERCAVTGIALPAILTASHIIPWRDSTDHQRLSGSNGILLAAHLDRLFDRFLIGFKPTGDADNFDMISSPRLKPNLHLLAAVGMSKLPKLNLSNVRFSSRSELERNLDAHLQRVLANH